MAINRKQALIAASKIYFRQLGRFQTLNEGFHMLMGGNVNELTDFKTFRTQTSPQSPVVLVNDLNQQFKNRGVLTVRMYMEYPYRAMPHMGGKEIAGREGRTHNTYMDITVDQAKQGLISEGWLEQQVETYSAMQLMKPALDDWGRSFMSESALYHMAGARGFYEDADNNLPVQGSAGLAAALVNPVLPPTYDRKLYAGNADSIDGTDPLNPNAITPADTFSLATIAKVAFYIYKNAGGVPFRPTNLGSSNTEGSRPRYVMFVTPAQWEDLYLNDGQEVERLITDAMARSPGWGHKVYNYEGFHYKGIWVTQNFMPIRFYAGDPVELSVHDAAATIRTERVPANVPAVDRAILLGAAGLATAYAADSNGTNMRFLTRKDGYEAEGTQASTVLGYKKIRMLDTRGRAYDNGIMCIDTAVSNPN